MADLKVEDFVRRSCGWEGCIWSRLVVDTLPSSVAIFYIDLDQHLNAEHGGNSAPPTKDAFDRLFGAFGG